MNKRKKWILIVAGILVVIALVATPTTLLLLRISGEEIREEEARQQELKLAFVQRYGAEAEVVEIIEPDNLYIYIWLEDTGGTVIRHFTLSIDGLFVELGQVEIAGDQ